MNKPLRCHRLVGQQDVRLFYIDRHLIHVVTSLQAFEGLRMTVRRMRLVSSLMAAAAAVTGKFTDVRKLPA